MTTVLLDSHVLIWWSSESKQLSKPAARAISGADELAVASITWFEIAWLVQNQRIKVSVPIQSWLGSLSGEVRTVCMTPAIAATAVSFPASFPPDPADRIIYATAIEQGWSLVTKDERLRRHKHPRKITVW